MKLKVLRADPAGNITLYVLDPVPTNQLAARLMELPGQGIEQVGFRCPPGHGCDGRMEMAGGEFCGNATRAYGQLTAWERGGAAPVRFEVSGCDHPVTVITDLAAGTAQTEMSLPLYTKEVNVEGNSGALVAAVAQSLNASDGQFVQDYIQPARTVQAGVLREGGLVTAVWIGGPVSLGEPFEAEL